MHSVHRLYLLVLFYKLDVNALPILPRLSSDTGNASWRLPGFVDQMAQGWDNMMPSWISMLQSSNYDKSDTPYDDEPFAVSGPSSDGLQSQAASSPSWQGLLPDWNSFISWLPSLAQYWKAQGPQDTFYDYSAQIPLAVGTDFGLDEQLEDLDEAEPSGYLDEEEQYGGIYGQEELYSEAGASASAVASSSSCSGCDGAYSDPDIQDALDAHNKHRAKYRVPPLQWSDRLAEKARSQASKQRCGQLQHLKPNPYGENLYWISGGTPTYDKVVGAWMNEPLGPGIYNHATQVLWRGSKQVGCAKINRCGVVVACEYYPPGNVIGQSYA